MVSRASLLVLLTVSQAALAAPAPANHTVGSLRVGLDAAGNLLNIGPASNPAFSFAPPPGGGHAGWGQVSARLRPVSQPGGSWGPELLTNGVFEPATTVPAGELALGHAVLDPGHDVYLEQHWAVGRDGHSLRLWHRVVNNGSCDVELGAYAVGMAANTKTGGQLDQLAKHASFADPYIGGQHGHVSFTRLTGEGAVLLVAASNGSSMEAYLDSWSGLRPQYGWATHTLAWADTTWADAHGSWVNATSVVIPRQGSVVAASFHILLAEGGAQHKDDTLLAAGRPVVHAAPGYVLGTDMTTAQLHVHPPAHATLTRAVAVNDYRDTAPPCMRAGGSCNPTKI